MTYKENPGKRGFKAKLLNWLKTIFSILGDKTRCKGAEPK